MVSQDPLLFNYLHSKVDFVKIIDFQSNSSKILKVVPNSIKLFELETKNIDPHIKCS